MEVVTRKRNNFDRIFLRYKPYSPDGNIEGMHIDIYKDELILNVLKYINDDELGETDVPTLISIDISSGNETLLVDEKLDRPNVAYGDKFHVLHGYEYEKVFTKHYVVSRQANEGAVVVYDRDFKQQYAFDGGVIRFIESDASRNFIAMIAEKEVTEKHVTGQLEMLMILNQYDFERKNYDILCKTHDKTEMISVACSDDMVYLLEYRKFEHTELHDDVYSIYTIDPSTGVRIGRGDIHLFKTEPKDDEKQEFKLGFAKLYFEDNKSPEYGEMIYSDGALYQPNGYHSKGRKVRVIEPTSCNGIMPCSQWLKYSDIVEMQENGDELAMYIVGIDSVGGQNVAVSYITLDVEEAAKCEEYVAGPERKYRDDNDWVLDKYTSYHVDIVDMGKGPSVTAFDSLDFDKFIDDFRAGCHVRSSFILSMPFAFGGKRMTCTEKYIAVPVLLEPINFEEHPHMESAIALFDKNTFAYVSYIELGKDYHIDETKEVIHPNPPIVCDKLDSDDVKTIEAKMDIEIIDIDSDCSKIAVTYMMSFKNYDEYIEQAIPYEQEETDIPIAQIYTEVFEDISHGRECDRRAELICERAKNRSWHVGTKKI